MHINIDWRGEAIGDVEIEPFEVGDSRILTVVRLLSGDECIALSFPLVRSEDGLSLELSEPTVGDEADNLAGASNLIHAEFDGPGARGSIHADFDGPGARGYIHAEFDGPGARGSIHADFDGPGASGSIHAEFDGLGAGGKFRAKFYGPKASDSIRADFDGPGASGFIHAEFDGLGAGGFIHVGLSEVEDAWAQSLQHLFRFIRDRQGADITLQILGLDVDESLEAPIAATVVRLRYEDPGVVALRIPRPSAAPRRAARATRIIGARTLIVLAVIATILVGYIVGISMWEPAGEGAAHSVSEKYDLDLMSVATIHDLLDEGRSLIVVALIGTDLHIRIFDAKGKIVVDKDETDLLRGESLTALKLRLNPFPDVSTLSPDDKREIIKNATSSSGHTLAEGPPRLPPAGPQPEATRAIP